MAWVHLNCGKKISPIKAGESVEYSGNSTSIVCPVCYVPIMKGDTVVERKPKDAYMGFSDMVSALPPIPTSQIMQVNTDALADKLLPKVLQAVKDLLPQVTKDHLPKTVESLAKTELHALAADLIREAGAPQVIKVGELPSIDVAHEHKQFPKLLKALIAGCNVWLAGPSGSGKTTAAMHVAKGLGCAFRYTGAVSDAYGLLGFKNAVGEYVRTPFRDAWEHGGVFLWDEIDASDPNALLAFNAALANNACAFPDATIPKNPALHIVAAANTWGHGATNEYVGRNKIDAAFLKRFAFLSWDYDEDLERNTCSNKEWCATVQKVRKRVQEQKIRVLVTPRETYIGERLLAAGLTQSEVEEMTIRSGMTQEQWDKVKPLKDYSNPDQKETDWKGMVGIVVNPSKSW